MAEMAEEELYDSPEDMTKQTAIQNRYCFWCHKRGKQPAPTNYEEAMKPIGNFQTIEHFWRIYNHLHRPSEFKTTTDYHLFKHGIKPTWEDPQNERGGKWMVRLKKGLSTRYWEELIIAIIGEQFDVGQEICGAVVSVRNNEDIISVWNKNADNTEAKTKIRDQMRRILKLPAFINVEYKKHQDSIADKSSFRNTVVWRSENTHDRNGPRKPRTDWSNDKGEHGNDRTHGHYRNDRSKESHDHSPRSAYAARFNSGAEKDKETSHRSWQQGSNSSNTGNWKSPRSQQEHSSTSPRYGSSAWATSSAVKPSPTATPSTGSGGNWRTDGSKTEGTKSSSYVPLGNKQGASPRGRTSSEEEHRKHETAGSQSENVWSRGKKDSVI